MITSLRQLIQPELIPLFREMGNIPWMLMNRDPGKETHWIRLRIPPEHNRFRRMVGDLAVKDKLAVYAMTRLCAVGPKMLSPTVEQCEALEQVDVNLSFEEYEQPFPLVLVELPEAYRSTLRERFHMEPPLAVLVTNESMYGGIYVESLCGPKRSGTSNLMSNDRGWKRIEDALRHKQIAAGADVDLGIICQRLAINFCLLLVHYGVKDLGPADPKAFAKQSESLRLKKNPEKLARAQEMLENTIYSIGFEQDIQFYEEITEEGQPSDGDGPPKKPHWRRGHLRRQRYGTGLLLRRLRFIKPILVKRALYKGDPGDTLYRIHG